MRRGNDAAIMRDEEGRFIAVNLGADYVAEHEVGTKELDRKLGIDPSREAGIERRRIRNTSYIAKDDKRSLIAVLLHPDYDIGHLGHELRAYRDEEVVGAWSDTDFGVWFSKGAQAEMAELWDALQAHDVAVLSMNTFDNPFARSGLVLAIVSRLPQEVLDNLREKYLDREALDAAVAATGIMARLEAWKNEVPGPSYFSGRGWFALSPRWANDEKTDIAFWLNPYDQANNYFGLVTVKDLDDWIAGTGKIPGGAHG